MTVRFGISKNLEHNSNPSISAKEKPAEMRVFPLFMRVFLLFVLCAYCSFFAFYCVLRAQKKHSPYSWSATALLPIKQCAFLSAFGSLLLPPQGDLSADGKGLAVLGAGRHAQGAGRIGDDQAGNVPYAVAGKAAPQRSAGGQRRSGSRI